MKSAPNQPICGATNRQGQPCQRLPAKGKTRCKLHGGATPKGRQTGPLTHGLYSKAMSPAEVTALMKAEIDKWVPAMREALSIK